jgi:hypothetical protein
MVVNTHEACLPARFLADVIAKQREFMLGGLDLDFLHIFSG